MSHSDYLEHYGVKGMRWGVRKDLSPTRDERKQKKTLTRGVAAAKKNLKQAGEAYADSQRAIDTARKNYTKAQKKMYLRRKNRLAAIKKASDELSKAFELNEVPASEMKRAVSIYNDAAKKLEKHTDSMLEKYGSQKVKGLKYNGSIVYGKKLEREGFFTDTYSAYVIDNIIKTGPTVVSIPFYGQRYTGKYVAPKELDERTKKFEKQASKRY